jgi:type VI secretion system protein ImpF
MTPFPSVLARTPDHMAKTNEEPVRLSLLDRLIGERGDAATAPHGPPVRLLKEAVRRDLEDLLNSKRQWDIWPDAWEELNDSLANYGIPDFTGVVYAGPSAQNDLKRMLEDTIQRFEPRLTQVQVEIVSRRREVTRQLRFRVKALLRMDPFSEQISFESEVEPGSRMVRVREAAR